MKTELAVVPEKYFPLSSLGPRERNVSMATYLLSQIRIALNMDTVNYPDHCDCVILKGGNIRGERDYDTNKITLEALKSELQDTEPVHIFKVRKNFSQHSIIKAVDRYQERSYKGV